MQPSTGRSRIAFRVALNALLHFLRLLHALLHSHGTHHPTRPRQVALKLVPSKREFLQRLGPLVAEEVTEAELRDHAEVVKQITDTLRTLFRELDLEDTRKV